MGIDTAAAETWSVDRLRFEIDRLRSERGRHEADLRQLETEYDINPGAWGGSYPIGLDYLPKEISQLSDQIDTLENILRKKL